MKTSATRIRLSEKEREDLDVLATRLKVSRSELIRRFIRTGICKNESVQIISWDNETIQTIRNYNMLIAKIGINVNQIARACNTGNTNIALQGEIQELQRILDDMKKVVSICQ